MNLSLRTIANYEEKLGHFLAWVDVGPHELGRDDLRRFLEARRATGAGTFTIHGFWRVLRTFFRYLLAEKVLDHDPTAGLEEPVLEEKLPVAFDTDSLARTLAAINRRDPLGVRDYAALTFMADGWARLEEVVTLRLDALDLRTCSAKLYGKGRRERVVGYGRTTAAALARWLALRSEVECPQVFVNRYGQPLSACTLSQRIKAYTRAAGVARFRLGAHAARHFGGIQSTAAGMPMPAIQRQLGHTTLEMTRTYARIADEAALRSQQWVSPVDRLLGKERRVVL